MTVQASQGTRLWPTVLGGRSVLGVSSKVLLEGLFVGAVLLEVLVGHDQQIGKARREVAQEGTWPAREWNSAPGLVLAFVVVLKQRRGGGHVCVPGSSPKAARTSGARSRWWWLLLRITRRRSRTSTPLYLRYRPRSSAVHQPSTPISRKQTLVWGLGLGLPMSLRSSTRIQSFRWRMR